jgi:hemoglobin-like flavoprotein
VTERIDVFKASLRRCLGPPTFLERFYELFLASSPEVAAKFEGTDFQRQKAALRDSFFVMETVAESAPSSPPWAALRKLAVTHDRDHRDVPPEMYDLWLSCLIEAVSEYDPQFSPEVERAWRETLTVGIDYMRGAYPGS